MSQDKKYSTSSSFSFVVDPNGAWVPRELSLKRVHVYSYFQFTERMLWDNCITKCIYLFIIFYLKLTYITACLLKQKESEQNGECGSDYSNSCLCFKVPVIWYIYLLCFSFLFLSACLWTCSREMAGRSCLVTLKKREKKERKNSHMKFLPLQPPFVIYCPISGQQHESPRKARQCEFPMCTTSHVYSCPVK